MKSLDVYHWYVKIPRYGCVEHGVEYIRFYVHKHIAHLDTYSWPSRRTARGAHICETRLLPETLVLTT